MARLPTSRVQPRAVTASAAKLTRKDSDYQKRIREGWQFRALAYYDMIGELRYASQFYARQISAVRYFPARQLPDGTTEPIKTGLPVDLLDRIQDPGGGRSQLQFDYGRLMFVTGEGVLFGSKLQTDQEKWRFLWNDEVRFTDDGAVRLNAQKQPIPGETGVGYRFWTPHPRHSDLADSPLRPVLDIAEELIILTQSVRSTAVTRLTKGILAIAQELSPPPSEPGHDEDPEQNPFMSDLMDHIQAEIDNPGTAAASTPFILEGAFDYIAEGIKWINLHDPATDYMEKDLRVEAIRRLALSLDMPPEALLGMTDANHWTAKQVQHDMWRAHGIQPALRFAEGLADAYLRPALFDAEYADWNHVVIDMDDSHVVISPDRSADADEAADRGMVSSKGYRELKGIDESMAPSTEEHDEWLAIKLRDPAIIDPSLAPTPMKGPVAAPGTDPRADMGPPEPTNGRVVSRQESRTASVLGAASLALRQCRAKAGARLRSTFTDSCPECRQQTSELPHSMVAAALGPDQIIALGARTPADLVKGGSDEFRGILKEWGFAPGAIDLLCSRVEAHAAATLFTQSQPDLPTGFQSIVEEVDRVAA